MPWTAPSAVSFVKSTSLGKAIADRMPRMMITVTSSITVKPHDLYVIGSAKHEWRPRAALCLSAGIVPCEVQCSGFGKRDCSGQPTAIRDPSARVAPSRMRGQFNEADKCGPPRRQFDGYSVYIWHGSKRRLS